MPKIEFIEVATDEQKLALADMAEKIWNEYWPAIIGQKQTDYMVAKFQSLEAIKRDMADEGYEYWFIAVCEEDGEMLPIGYTGGHVEEDSNRFFISKVYLLESERGGGLCSQVVKFYENLCRSRGLDAVYLTVNKNNSIAIRAYKKNGFEIIDAVEKDIGCGFVMDDYIMEKKVTA